MRLIACLLLMFAVSTDLAVAQGIREPRAPGPSATPIADASRLMSVASLQVGPTLRPPLRRGRGPRLMPAIAVGAAIGAAFGAGMAKLTCEGSPCGTDLVKGALVGGASGAGVGFVVALR